MTRELPHALLDPAVYPHRPDSVELRETHISWVFLAGEEVYKVKKPVTFPFLDYGTLALRREACHAEVALNRRFAPDLYRGVVAFVPGADGGLAVAGEDDPRAVEYAVLMRRFDESATLAARAERGDLEAEDACAVGRAVAGFHAAAPVERDIGGTEWLVGPVLDETLATLTETGAPRARLARLERFCRAAVAGLGAELDRRAAEGRVRDGHGDLRAEHVLPGEPVQAVDGVEFDRALRVADVGYDLAFLVMDVARIDDALSRAIVRGYRAAGGDPGSDALLDFFCAVRALVRAKVDFLRAAQLSGEQARDRAARAEGLLGTAERFAWRARLPRLVCVAGLAASGKSTVAEALAEAAGRCVLSSDRVRKQRLGIAEHERAGAEAYSDDEIRAVYQQLGQRAAAALHRDGGVIVDATFRRPQDVEAFAGVSPVVAHPAWIVCDAPPEVLLERAKARMRGESVSDAGPEVVAAQIAACQGRYQPPAPPLARLDTTRPVKELLDDLAAELDAKFEQPA